MELQRVAKLNLALFKPLAYHLHLNDNKAVEVDMKWVKAIVFSYLALSLTHFAVGQAHDPFVMDRLEGVKSVKLFPNPASDFLSLKFETPVAKTVKVTVHNIIGNRLEVDSEAIDDYELRLKVKDLPEGVYLLSIKGEDNAQSTFKFLKRE